MSAGQMSVREVVGIAVPVAEQDRALRFYTDALGFEVRLDVAMQGGARWLQVALPGDDVTIALVAAGTVSSGTDRAITFGTSDAATDHGRLVAHGVDVDELLRWPGVPAMFTFRDVDGNQLKLMETAAPPGSE